jgi:hypothetical protein
MNEINNNIAVIEIIILFLIFMITFHTIILYDF